MLSSQVRDQYFHQGSLTLGLQPDKMADALVAQWNVENPNYPVDNTGFDPAPFLAELLNLSPVEAFKMELPFFVVVNLDC